MIKTRHLLILLHAFSLSASPDAPVMDHLVHTSQEIASTSDFTIPLQNFIDLISNIRSATSHSSQAKAQAVTLFTEMYEQGNDEIKELLAHLTLELKHILGRNFILPSTKDRLVLLLLNVSHDHLRIALKNQPEITLKPNKLTEAIYTAVNPTFSDFWRRVRIAVGLGAGVLTMAYAWKKLYTVDILKTLNKNYDPADKNILRKFVYELSETFHQNNLPQAQQSPPGGITLLAQVLTKIAKKDEEKGKEVLYGLAQSITHALSVSESSLSTADAEIAPKGAMSKIKQAITKGITSLATSVALSDKTPPVALHLALQNPLIQEQIVALVKAELKKLAQAKH